MMWNVINLVYLYFFRIIVLFLLLYKMYTIRSQLKALQNYNWVYILVFANVVVALRVTSLTSQGTKATAAIDAKRASTTRRAVVDVERRSEQLWV